MGYSAIVEGPEGSMEVDVPADPKIYIELSKEISRLIAESKGQNITGKAAVIIASKENAADILDKFLND